MYERIYMFACAYLLEFVMISREKLFVHNTDVEFCYNIIITFYFILFIIFYIFIIIEYDVGP